MIYLYFLETRQSHTTIAVVEQYSDGSYILKALKQKLFVDGLCYLLQEIYGIENKITELKVCNICVYLFYLFTFINFYFKDSGEEDLEDGSSECVICMSDMRDTLILPCRHLCLCQSCADSLRYQANNCPICRVPFRALLQIKALQKTLDNNHRVMFLNLKYEKLFFEFVFYPCRLIYALRMVMKLFL